MRKTKTQNALKQVLDACDRLGALGARAEAVPTAPASRKLASLKLASRRRLARLIEERAQEDFSETLSALRRDHGFSEQEVIVLLIALHKRIARGNVFVPAREVLETVFDTSYDVLRGMSLLRADAPLRTSGVVVSSRDDEEDEILDVEVKLADDVFRMFSMEVGAVPPRKSVEGAPATPYTCGTDYLLDMKRLSLAYQRRACRLFATDEAEPTENGRELAPSALEAEIADVAQRIRERLLATPNACEFPLVKLSREHGLTALEEMVVVTLLFQEVFTGQGCLAASTLLKVISASERDLLRKRALLAPESRLVGSGVVCLDDAYAEKPLTADAYLPQTVTDRLLAEVGPNAPPLDADARLSFHQYLEKLADSDDFFERLG